MARTRCRQVSTPVDVALVERAKAHAYFEAAACEYDSPLWHATYHVAYMQELRRLTNIH